MKEVGHVSLAVALAVLASSACAMTAPAAPRERCRVLAGEKLPAASGGPAHLCAAIDRAVAARGVPGNFTVAVRVGARSMLTAQITLADGSVLPELHMAEMDRAVTRDTLDRFGAAVADHIAGAAR